VRGRILGGGNRGWLRLRLRGWRLLLRRRRLLVRRDLALTALKLLDHLRGVLLVLAADRAAEVTQPSAE
jgi:hypothetical protein